jgi:hypothetical protein
MTPLDYAARGWRVVRQPQVPAAQLGEATAPARLAGPCQLAEVPTWLLDAAYPKPKPAPPRASAPASGNSTAADRAWALAALRNACARIAGLTDGRRAALYREAFLIGGYVAGGHVDYAQAERELVDAGVATGTKHDVPREVRAGLDAGAKKPLHPPPPPPKDSPPMTAPPQRREEADDVGNPSISLPTIRYTTELHVNNDAALRALAVDPGL